jgi:hypothetical protein
MPEPRDDRVASRGRLRASRADREQVIDTLKAAFVEDRLTKDEFDARVGDALASRTHADLEALTVDLPATPATAQRPRRPEKRPEKRPGNTTVKSGARVIAATTVLTGGVWAGALLSQSDIPVWAALVWTVSFLWLGIVILVGSVILESRHQERSDGQLPPSAGDGGQPSRRAIFADPTRPLRPRDRGRPRAAPEASGRLIPRRSLLLGLLLSPS